MNDSIDHIHKVATFHLDKAGDITCVAPSTMAQRCKRKDTLSRELTYICIYIYIHVFPLTGKRIFPFPIGGIYIIY